MSLSFVTAMIRRANAINRLLLDRGHARHQVVWNYSSLVSVTKCQIVRINLVLQCIIHSSLLSSPLSPPIILEMELQPVYACEAIGYIDCIIYPLASFPSQYLTPFHPAIVYLFRHHDKLQEEAVVCKKYVQGPEVRRLYSASSFVQEQRPIERRSRGGTDFWSLLPSISRSPSNANREFV